MWRTLEMSLSTLLFLIKRNAFYFFLNNFCLLFSCNKLQLQIIKIIISAAHACIFLYICICGPSFVAWGKKKPTKQENPLKKNKSRGRERESERALFLKNKKIPLQAHKMRFNSSNSHTDQEK